MIGVAAYRFPKATSGVSQLEAPDSAVRAIVVNYLMSRASTSAMRQDAVSGTEARVTLFDTGFMSASQAPRSRSTAGYGRTLARSGQRPISASYREVMHAACER